MIKVITQTTAEREQEYRDNYERFKELFYTTTLSLDEIAKKLDIPRTSKMWKRIRHEWKANEDIDSAKRTFLIRHNKWEV